jgi:hypothetical protein
MRLILTFACASITLARTRPQLLSSCQTGEDVEGVQRWKWTKTTMARTPTRMMASPPGRRRSKEPCKSHAKESSTPPFRTAHPRCLDGPKEVEKTETFAVEQRGLGRDVASLRAAIGPTPLRTLCGRSSWHVPQRCMFSLSLAGEEILL